MAYHYEWSQSYNKESEEITDCYNTGVELENVTDDWYDSNGQLKH